MYTPTSDIDLVVMAAGAPGGVQAALRALAARLARDGTARAIQVIAKARVPIIKFEAVPSGLAFDVSFDVANGPEAAGLVKRLAGRWAALRPLLLGLKLFLQQRDLHEVYTGGVGSYALLAMVASFLQLHASRAPDAAAAVGLASPSRGRSGGSRGSRAAAHAAPLEANLGLLLVDFFRLYGRALNTSRVGVSCASGGAFFAKRRRGGEWFNAERHYLLAVEDPQDAANDVGRNSFNVMRVRAAFDFAYQALTAPCGPRESLLVRILRLEPLVEGRWAAAPQPRRPLASAASAGRRDDGEEDNAPATASAVARPSRAAATPSAGASGEGTLAGDGKRKKERHGKQKRRRGEEDEGDAADTPGAGASGGGGAAAAADNAGASVARSRKKARTAASAASGAPDASGSPAGTASGGGGQPPPRGSAKGSARAPYATPASAPPPHGTPGTAASAARRPQETPRQPSRFARDAGAGDHPRSQSAPGRPQASGGGGGGGGGDYSGGGGGGGRGGFFRTPGSAHGSSWGGGGRGQQSTPHHHSGGGGARGGGGGGSGRGGGGGQATPHQGSSKPKQRGDHIRFEE